MRRIFDVNFNRAREALRVIEDYARLTLESSALSAQIKTARHSLNDLSVDFFSAIATDADENFASNWGRDITGDCGVQIKASDENFRADIASVLRANLNRAAESLRTLAEFGKVINAEIAGRAENLRYEIYRWEPRLLANFNRRNRLRSAQLYVLITKELATADPLTVCRETVAGGADIVQLREKNLEDGEFYELAKAAKEICGEKTLLIINDRPHLTALANADGIHTGQGDLPPHLTRRIIGEDRLIGVSTSAPEFAVRAAQDMADYIGVGPVYPTNTKLHRRAVGLEYVAWAAKNSALPYFCIGGIKRENIGDVIKAGARAVAVCTGIIGAKDIAEETAKFKKILAEA